MNAPLPSLPPRRIWYVGAKGDQPNGETAFSHLTGIVWRTGDVHDIAAGVASQLLAHPDVFSDKSPEERKLLAEKARLEAQQRAAAGAPTPASSLEALLGALPPGTSITLPNGIKIDVPAGGLAASPTPTQPTAKGGSLEGAHTSSVARRMAAATGADNSDGAPTTPLNAPVDAAALGLEPVTETKVAGDTDASTISLAPGATVAPAPTAAPAPAPTPAPTQAPAPAPATGKKAK